jgi:hypothetical protein
MPSISFLQSALLINIKSDEQKNNQRRWPPYGLCRPSYGSRNTIGGGIEPLTHSNLESNVSGRCCLTQIAVDFYLDNDVRKAGYFQKKLNSLLVKSLSASSV